MEDAFDPLDMRLSQVRQMKRDAGAMEPAALARALGLTEGELAQAAAFYGVDVRYREPLAVWCATCCAARIPMKYTRGGNWCPVCNARATRDEALAFKAEQYARLDPRDQARVGRNCKTHGYRKKTKSDVPPPRAADYDTGSPSRYVAKSEADRYAADLAAWEVARYAREVKTYRRSGERWKKKASDAQRWSDPEKEPLAPGEVREETRERLREAARKGAAAYTAKYGGSVRQRRGGNRQEQGERQ